MTMVAPKGIFAAVTAIALGATVFAGGSESNSDLKFRVRDEVGPPGGVVQMKVESYEVTPISGGRPSFGFDSRMFADAEGFDMVVDGELAGAAVIDGSRVALSYATNDASTTDYPILSVSMRIRPDAAIGARTTFALDPQSTWHVSPTGQPLVASRLRPGTVTVGGSVSITDVRPGAGVWPAGTVVKVRGIGFNSRTRLKVDDLKTRSIRFINSTEMQFTLAETGELHGVRLRAENSDFRSEYYAYMRGIVSTVSSRPLLAGTVPIFSMTRRAAATLGPFPLSSEHQYAGLGLQNPTLVDVAVGIELYDAGGALLYRSVRSLAGQQSLAMELSELLDGVTPPSGSSVRVTASAPIEAIGLLCDEGSWTVSPSLPLEALR